MTDPLSTLIGFTEQLHVLGERQHWIDAVRQANPKDQATQLLMDRQQTDLDQQRFYISTLMVRIRSQN